MSLYTKKKDVDHFVKELLSKVKAADERALRGFSIARMYHHVGEHRTALEYLDWYLKAKPGAAPAHKLRGQVLAATGDRPAALAAYQRSLELDPHQKGLVMTGCQLLLDLPPNSAPDGRWLQQAGKYFPNDPILIKLKERQLRSPATDKDLDDLEKLMADAVAAQPEDGDRHIRLMSQLTAAGRAGDAYSYGRQVEQRRPFPRSVAWYRCLADACQKHQASLASPSSPPLELQLTQLAALDRLVELELVARAPATQIVTSLYRLDQLLLQAGRDTDDSSKPEQTRLEARALLSHVTGQLFYHMACVLLYTAKGGAGERREAADMALVLLLAAQAFPPLEPVSRMYQLSNRQATLDVWRQCAGARLVEVGWCILAAERNSKPNLLLDVQQQFCNEQGRNRIHSRVFGGGALSSLGRRATSAFLTLPAFLETSPAAPRLADLAAMAGLFWAERAGSLHHAVWLRLRSGAAAGPALAADLRLGDPAVTSAAPETLCRIDVLAFLEATVYTTDQIRAAAGGRDPEHLFPPAVASPLCTPDQADWWSAVQRVHAESARRTSWAACGARSSAAWRWCAASADTAARPDWCCGWQTGLLSRR
ncbi:RANBP2-like and GRIP domain-containing protein 5/6 [Pollicipes pollicipes]|uniref:RANBP2-like and GRIP domain-containing protein 5/6 n=1 Tax=Pollicipes pollicipes TaxID=41117 RepID=UPI00188555D7|nr:RANBP2-like and GRIP domain-containing protein 5/6 [Pollicipes pollicipes]XP_037075156.1 RANBP2-like and GRIP domain-containing protein 5/6 [Pollicipes pollicipes]